MQASFFADGHFSVDESESDFDRRRSTRWKTLAAQSQADEGEKTTLAGRPSNPTSDSGGEFADQSKPIWHASFYPASPRESAEPGQEGAMHRRNDKSSDIDKLLDTALPFFSYKLPALERRQQSIQSEITGIQNKTLPSLLLKIEKLQMQVTKQQQQLAYLTGYSDDSVRTSASQKALLYSDAQGKTAQKQQQSLSTFIQKGLFRGRGAAYSDITTDIWPRIVMGVLSMVYPLLVYTIKGATVLIVLISGIVRSLSLFAPLFEQKSKNETTQNQDNSQMTADTLAVEGARKLFSHRQIDIPSALHPSEEGIQTEEQQRDRAENMAYPLVESSPTVSHREFAVHDEESPQRASFASTIGGRRENSLLHRLRRRDAI